MNTSRHRFVHKSKRTQVHSILLWRRNKTNFDISGPHTPRIHLTLFRMTYDRHRIECLSNSNAIGLCDAAFVFFFVYVFVLDFYTTHMHQTYIRATIRTINDKNECSGKPIVAIRSAKGTRNVPLSVAYALNEAFRFDCVNHIRGHFAHAHIHLDWNAALITFSRTIMMRKCCEWYWVAVHIVRTTSFSSHLHFDRLKTEFENAPITKIVSNILFLWEKQKMCKNCAGTIRIMGSGAMRLRQVTSSSSEWVELAFAADTETKNHSITIQSRRMYVCF